MNREDFYNEIIEAVREEVPDMLKEFVSVERIERMKVNDEKLIGICVRISETGVAPTIYLDDFYEAYQDGVPAEKIAQHILCMTAEAGMHAPEVEGVSMNYEDIADKLTMQMVEGERNKERLKGLLYRPIGNGMVLIPYIELGRDENGGYRAEVTKGMAEDFEYDVEALLDRAFDNLLEQKEPMLFKMGAEHQMFGEFPEGHNPMDEDFSLDSEPGMYILTNRYKDEGASVLFYPGMDERIGELLGSNYFALPSCLDEFIIVPEGNGPGLEHLREVVKEANRTVIPPDKILSDRVLYFDREKNKLYEPKGRERDGDERGDR